MHGKLLLYPGRCYLLLPSLSSMSPFMVHQQHPTTSLSCAPLLNFSKVRPSTAFYQFHLPIVSTAGVADMGLD